MGPRDGAPPSFPKTWYTLIPGLTYEFAGHEEPAAPNSSPDERHLRKELKSQLLECLTGLSRKEKETFLLRDIEELSVRNSPASCAIRISPYWIQASSGPSTEYGLCLHLGKRQNFPCICSRNAVNRIGKMSCRWTLS